MAGTLPPGGGSSMPPSNQVKLVVPNGANIYRKPNTPATVTGNVKQAGRPSSLPPGSPKKLPATGPGSTPPTTK